MTFWPQQCITLWSGVLPTKFGGYRALLSKLTPTWPQLDPNMTFDPNNALCFGQGFFPPNEVAIEHFLAIWLLVDPRWPLHDLWPQQCTALWSGVLLTKFGSHRAFVRQIDPWMTFNPKWGTPGGVASKICPQTSWAHPLPPCQVSARYLKAWQNA